MVQHPGFYEKSRKDFTYETNDKSLAYIPADEGEVYVMGGLNAGLAENYLELIDELGRRIEIDKTNDVIALWHDESHLNRYAIDFESSVKILDSSYGYPRGGIFHLVPKSLFVTKTIMVVTIFFEIKNVFFNLLKSCLHDNYESFRWPWKSTFSVCYGKSNRLEKWG